MSLAAYLTKNYGTCRLSPCVCVKEQAWKGRACPHWQPTTATTWGELLAEIRTKRERSR